MILVFIFLAILCVWKIQFSRFNKDYCGLDQATAIKGIFAFLIFFSHASTYIQFSGHWSDTYFLKIMGYIGQSVVALFFFYSGYGINESRIKKPEYGKKLTKRILFLLITLDIAVFFQLLTTTLLGIRFPITNYIFCWIGYKDIGNSNWFVFVLLSLYLISLIAMKFKNWPLSAKILFPIIGLWLFLYYFKKPEYWWYDSLIAFPLGVLYSEEKSSIDAFLGKNLSVGIIAIMLMTLLYLGAHHLMGTDDYGIVCALFCLMIVSLTTRILIVNPILNWLGRNALALYLLQRIPMMVLSHWGINENHFVFIILTLIITLPLSELFTKGTRFLNNRILARHYA